MCFLCHLNQINKLNKRRTGKPLPPATLMSTSSDFLKKKQVLEKVVLKAQASYVEVLSESHKHARKNRL